MAHQIDAVAMVVDCNSPLCALMHNLADCIHEGRPADRGTYRSRAIKSDPRTNSNQPASENSELPKEETAPYSHRSEIRDQKSEIRNQKTENTQK